MITSIDKNTALVLIDLQKGIVGMPVAHPIADVIANSAKLLAAFRKANLPVVIVNVDPIGAPSTLVRAEQNHMPKDAEGQKQMHDTMTAAGFFDIIEDIQTQADDIFITKQTWGAFQNTQLHEELQKRGITGIVLAGVATSIGVESTARCANERGYNISFAKDAMTDMVAAAHDNSLQYIFPRIGEVDTTDAIIAHLS